MSGLSHEFSDSHISIELIGDTYIARTVALINHAFLYQDAIKGEKRITEQKLREKIAKSEFYIWKYTDKVVACLYVEQKKDRLHFGLFSISDEHRGTGLAQKIMASLETYARALGKGKVELDYMSISPWLAKYYEKYGYIETGETEDIGWAKLVRMEKSLG